MMQLGFLEQLTSFKLQEGTLNRENISQTSLETENTSK